VLRFIYGDDLRQYPALRRTMFADRARQFHVRLGWDVSVDADGYETDQYDALNPLYVLWETPMGRHGGSMRFLPTTGRTMVNEHFSHLTPAGGIVDRTIWECTRFCLAEDAGPRVSAALMLGGAELGVSMALQKAVGIFDARMVRIYRLLGWPPEIVGRQGAGRDEIGCGLWQFSDAIRHDMALRAGLSVEISRHWFRQALGPARIAA
jgi:acyl homoserine lactone synthase